MTNSEIIAAVARWQADPRLYPLTCRTHNHGHELLQPVEKAGQVVLECPNCEYCQPTIPDAVLEWDGNLAWFLGISSARLAS
jgi:hypothetical protein